MGGFLNPVPAGLLVLFAELVLPITDPSRRPWNMRVTRAGDIAERAARDAAIRLQPRGGARILFTHGFPAAFDIDRPVFTGGSALLFCAKAERAGGAGTV